jgi:hypothetical protein
MDDQALAALSAALYVPMRRIGFLIMPPIWCLGGGLPVSAFADRARHISDFVVKIKSCVRLTTRESD